MNVETLVARCLEVSGTIQGVGFRPFIYQLARKNQIAGSIKNCGSHVDIIIQGSQVQIDSFMKAFYLDAPVLAEIKKVDLQPAEVNPALKEFSIEESSEGSCATHNLKDYAVCEECLGEFNDLKDRRYQYPFISCTNCGPRYSILKRFPLDRENTSYDNYPVCEACKKEYLDSGNRRFHAQNISCPDCGPEYYFKQGNELLNSQHEAINHCCEMLENGKIVCIKGTAGYRLFCDAENQAAIERLRALKHRPDKPFALMFPDDKNLLLLQEYLQINEADIIRLKQNTRPIVILEQKAAVNLTETIAPGLNSIGVMLPATGLEYFLLKRLNRPLVATSANSAGSNIITDQKLAEEKLLDITDGFLHHDLVIQNGLDDSLFKCGLPIRMGRAYAPHEYQLPFTLSEPMLAFGAQMKSTITLAWQDRAVVSQHLGDMDSYDVWNNTQVQINRLQKIYDVKASHYLIDAHPGYTSTQWVKSNEFRYTEIFHHHAHASALFFEHNCDSPILVFTWDGTGYGLNGDLWGGEAFYGKPGSWAQCFTARPFKLPGGAAAIKEPWRIAASLSWHVGQEYLQDKSSLITLKQLWESGINCPVTSSVGRLFDAAAVILGLVDEVSYDGQAAMILETHATDTTADFISLEIDKNDRGVYEFDWSLLLTMLHNSSLSVSYRSRVFHNSLANVILDKVRLFATDNDLTTVGFTGGVFQNILLKNLVCELLSDEGLDILFNEKIPANDAAISLGQIVEYGMGRIN